MAKKSNFQKFAAPAIAGVTAAVVASAATFFLTSPALLSSDEAADRVKSFAEEALLQPGMTAEVVSAEKKYGMHEITLSAGDQEAVTYLSADGGIFFLQGIEIETALAEMAEQAAAAETEQAEMIASIPKSERPQVELFVMSHCPYGTQIEKGMLPVVDLLGDSADIEIKFVDYAMHAEVELTEQLQQYCIAENFGQTKLWEYLGCFLEAGEGESCRTEMSLDVESCVAAADAEFSVMSGYADQSTWRSGRFPSFDTHREENEKYDVQGSPTLVINEKVVTVGRDSESLKQAVCAAFIDAPEACETTLSSAKPAPGFGFDGSAAAGSDATCG